MRRKKVESYDGAPASHSAAVPATAAAAATVAAAKPAAARTLGFSASSLANAGDAGVTADDLQPEIPSHTGVPQSSSTIGEAPLYEEGLVGTPAATSHATLPEQQLNAEDAAAVPASVETSSAAAQAHPSEAQEQAVDAQAQPSPWYDDAGNCWCDGPDGWRYWWDPAAQQWKQHSRVGGAASLAAAPEQQQDEQAAVEGVQPAAAADVQQDQAGQAAADVIEAEQAAAADEAVAELSGSSREAEVHQLAERTVTGVAASTEPAPELGLESVPGPDSVAALPSADAIMAEAAAVAFPESESQLFVPEGTHTSIGNHPEAGSAPVAGIVKEAAPVDSAVPELAASAPAVADSLPLAEQAEAVPAEQGAAAGSGAASAAEGSGTEQQQQPAPWYDDAGNCWCDGPDGWRYWWDAAAQQWQQHSRTPAAGEGEADVPGLPEHGQPGQSQEQQQQQQQEPPCEPEQLAVLQQPSSGDQFAVQQPVPADAAATGEPAELPPAAELEVSPALATEEVGPAGPASLPAQPAAEADAVGAVSPPVDASAVQEPEMKVSETSPTPDEPLVPPPTGGFYSHPSLDAAPGSGMYSPRSPGSASSPRHRLQERYVLPRQEAHAGSVSASQPTVDALQPAAESAAADFGSAPAAETALALEPFPERAGTAEAAAYFSSLGSPSGHPSSAAQQPVVREPAAELHVASDAPPTLADGLGPEEWPAGAAEEAAPMEESAPADQQLEQAVAEPDVNATREAKTEDQQQPAPWYDDTGNCWCDGPDGWRYWWDPAVQQWQQHSRVGGAAGTVVTPEQEREQEGVQPAAAAEVLHSQVQTEQDAQVEQSVAALPEAAQAEQAGLVEQAVQAEQVVQAEQASPELPAADHARQAAAAAVPEAEQVEQYAQREEMEQRQPSSAGATGIENGAEGAVESALSQLAAAEAAGDLASAPSEAKLSLPSSSSSALAQPSLESEASAAPTAPDAVAAPEPSPASEPSPAPREPLVPPPTGGFYSHPSLDAAPGSGMHSPRSPGSASSPRHRLQERYVLPRQEAHAGSGAAAAEPPAVGGAPEAEAPTPAAAMSAANDAAAPPSAAQVNASNAFAAGPPLGEQAAVAEAEAAPEVPPSPSAASPVHSFSAATAPPFGGSAPEEEEGEEADLWLGAGPGEREPGSYPVGRPPLAPQPCLQLSSGSNAGSGDASPHHRSASDLDSSHGFGSVMQLGSETSSRHSSLPPMQMAAAVAAAVAAAAAAGSGSGSEDGDGADSALRAAPSFGLGSTPAEPSAAAVSDTAGASSAVEGADVADAEVEAEWVMPAEPATTFQVLSKPLFGSSEDDIAAFDDLSVPAQEAPSPSAFFEQPAADLGPSAASPPEPAFNTAAWEQAPPEAAWQQQAHAEVDWMQQGQEAAEPLPWEQHAEPTMQPPVAQTWAQEAPPLEQDAPVEEPAAVAWPQQPEAAGCWQQQPAPWEESDAAAFEVLPAPQQPQMQAAPEPQMSLPTAPASTEEMPAAVPAATWQPGAEAEPNTFFDSLAGSGAPSPQQQLSAAQPWELADQPSLQPTSTGAGWGSGSAGVAAAAPFASADFQAAAPHSAVSDAASQQPLPDSMPAQAAAQALPPGARSADMSPAPASSSAFSPVQHAPAAQGPTILQGMEGRSAAVNGAATAQVTKGTAQPAQREPAPWYDDAGVCWSEPGDGWRYWWDAAAQQWRQHSPAASGQPDVAEQQAQPTEQPVAAPEPVAEAPPASWVAPGAADSFGMPADRGVATLREGPFAGPAEAEAETDSWEMVPQNQQAPIGAQAPWQPGAAAEPAPAAAPSWQQPPPQQPWQPAHGWQQQQQQQPVQQEQQWQQPVKQQQQWQQPACFAPTSAAGSSAAPAPAPFLVPGAAAGPTLAGAAAQVQATAMFQPHSSGTQQAANAPPAAPGVSAAGGQTFAAAAPAFFPGQAGAPAAAFAAIPSQTAFAAAASAGLHGTSGSAGGYPLHGRPAAPFGKLLFGGRLLVVAPTGHLQLHSLVRAPAEALQPLPGAPTTSLGAMVGLLESFPGPLGSGTNKEKVAKFCAEQAEAAAAQGGSGGEDSATLWAVLRVLALHQGRISSTPYAMVGSRAAGSSKRCDPDALPEAQLSAALLGDAAMSGGSTHELLLPGCAPATPAASAAAAAEVQQLLLQGKRSDALRVAIDAQLWPIALLVSRLLGEAGLSAATAAMAEQCIAPGAPLQTLLLLAGGAPAAQPLLAAAADAASTPAAPAVPSAPAGGWQQPGMFNPATSGSAGTSNTAATWRRHLAIIAANRTAGDESAMLLLGSQLLASGQLLPAHICFVLAGSLLTAWDAAAGAAGSATASTPSPLTAASAPTGTSAAAAASGGPPMVLLGADAVGSPRVCAQLSSILRTQVYTWSRTVGNTALSGQYLPVVPYKLLHAYTLAELGLLQQASAYCSSISATMQTLGSKLPPGLLVCRAVTADLTDRLQQFAAGQKLSLGGSFSAGAIVSSMGKWLDRGLNAMLGGGSDAGSVSGRHSRNPSISSVDGKDIAAKRPPSGTVLRQSGGTDGMLGSGSGDDEPSKKAGLFHRVSSITSLLRPKADGTSPAQDPPATEPENVFYYDHDLKQWRERGVEPAPLPEPLAPPPTALPHAPPMLSGAGAGPSVPPLPRSGGLVAQRAAVGARYALSSSFGMQPASGSLAPSLLPQPGGVSSATPATWQPSTVMVGTMPGGVTSSQQANEATTSSVSVPQSIAGPPPTAAPPLSANGLRIQHTRALSADSSSSGLYPGIQFA